MERAGEFNRNKLAMRILQVIDSLGNGGAEKFTVALGNELAVSHEVTLCSLRPIEKWMLPPKLIHEMVEVIDLGGHKKYSISSLRKLINTVRKRKPDVVLAQSSIAAFYAFIVSLLYSRPKYFQVVHSTLTPGYRKVFRTFSALSPLSKRMSNICISGALYQQFRNTYPKLRFLEIDNGLPEPQLSEDLERVRLELKRYKKDDSTKVFLAVGNYSDYKNFVVLTEVFRQLHLSGRNTVLLIIGGGGGASATNYEKVAAVRAPNTHQLGLRGNVADYMACADALIVPSTKEGMPLVIIEAFASSLPVIATPAGGVVDMVEHRRNGLLSRGFSQQEILESIKEFLLLSETEVKLMRSRARETFSERYSISKSAIKYLDAMGERVA